MASDSLGITSTPFGPLPREPSAYRASEHFQWRFKTRDDPPVTTEVIQRCIRDGTAKTTQSADRYIFEATVPCGLRDVRWWVLVALDADGPPYTVITAYSPDEHDPSTEERAPL